MSTSSECKSSSSASILGLMLPFSLYNPVLQLKAVADAPNRLFSHPMLANANASHALHSALHLPSASLHHASLQALRHSHLSPLTNSSSSVHSSSSPSVSPALPSPPPPAGSFSFPFGHPPSQSPHSPKSLSLHHQLHPHLHHHHHHNHVGRLKFSIDNILSPTFGANGLPLKEDDVSRSPSSSPTSSIGSKVLRLSASSSAQVTSKCTSNVTINTPSTSSTTSTNCKRTGGTGVTGPHALSKRKYSSDSESSNSSAASSGLSLKKSPKKEPNSSGCSNAAISSSSSSPSSCKPGQKVNKQGASSSSSGSSSSSSSSEYNATDESVKDPNKNPSLTFPLDGKDPIVWPAWVYCTRYSDRPSSGPRSRRSKAKEKKADEKRPRTAFTAEQLARLKQEFQDNKYLTEKRRQDLARDLKLNESQIKIWFQNKRAKIKKTTSQRNPLALHLAAQGLYNHTTASMSGGDDDDDEMIDVDRPSSAASTNGGNGSFRCHSQQQQSANQLLATSVSSPEPSMADHSMSSDQ